MTNSDPKRVVILVDNRRRDLPSAALIAYQLEQRSVKCFLEPLEAYQGILAAHRPHLIVFNHLTASHLERYSQRVGEMGVLTAVILNEGILYDEGEMKFNAGRFHNNAHIDFYFCWNEPHRQALLAEGFGLKTRIEVVGVPRYDYYVKPWSRVFHPGYQSESRKRPKVLVCTNFVTARFWDLSRAEGDKFFAAWKDRIPAHRDYWTAVEIQHRSRQKTFDYLNRLVAAGEFDVVVRPHPNEDQRPYRQWYDSLPSALKSNITLDAATNITTQILDCDLEISCETCLTALEAWMAGKPTIQLIFEKYALWFHEEHAKPNVPCNEPDELVPLIRRLLKEFNPASPPVQRLAHLKKWCHSMDGASCKSVATVITDAVARIPEPDWSQLTANDYRRAVKLKLLRAFGLPYHFNPFLPLKRALRPQKYAVKSFAYSKSIRPRDVAEARLKIERALTAIPD